MREFRRICVYCGSNPGHDPAYGNAARELGTFLAKQGISVVYGGGRVGLMGALADAVLSSGGEIFGVIPEKLKNRELGHEGLTELFVVDGMHARKMLMANLADAFIAMPGGFGTLEELFEATTWTQLNYHKKPVGLLNVEGYFDGLISFLDKALSEGFIRPIHRPLIQAGDTPQSLLQAMQVMEIPDFERWIEKP